MIRKTLLAAVALATLGGTTAFAGNYNYGNYGNYNYGHHHNRHYSNNYVIQRYVPVYQPQYQKVCQPVYETKYFYDQYSYSYVAKQVIVGQSCSLVQIR